MTGDTYLVVGGIAEAEITTSEQYDAIVCTGDILDLAPPPGADPDGSLIDAYADDAAALYAADDTPCLLDTIREMQGDDAVYVEACARYEAFFETVDTPFYYVAGNQDFPDLLASVAPDHVQHVSALDGWAAVDGMIPEDIPADVFPTTIEEDAIYDAITDDVDVLVAHDLPDGFDAAAHGLDHAVCSTHANDIERENGVTRLPSYRRTGASVVLDV